MRPTICGCLSLYASYDCFCCFWIFFLMGNCFWILIVSNSIYYIVLCRFSYPALVLVATNVGSLAPNLRTHKAIVLPRWCMRVLGRAARELACFGLLRGHTHVHQPHVHVCLPAHSPTKHHSRFFHPSYSFLCFRFFEICVHFFPLLQYLHLYYWISYCHISRNCLLIHLYRL